jgi:hypothetical protein
VAHLRRQRTDAAADGERRLIYGSVLEGQQARPAFGESQFPLPAGGGVTAAGDVSMEPAMLALCSA